MSEKVVFDFWYAVNNTEVVLMPQRHLETFGATLLNYYLVSELMDTISQTRVREGRIQANQPQIITPEAYSKTLLEGFGEEAGKYVEWLKTHEKQLQILQYGYSLKQESYKEYTISESREVVLERVMREVRQKSDPLSAVVSGVDAPWDVCLIKLFWEVVQSSAQTNVRELSKRSLFDMSGGIPKGIRHEVERAFLEASRNPTLIPTLGDRLQRHGLFEEYQDRFFALVKASKS